MRIGIGITTYNRPNSLKVCLDHMKAFALDIAKDLKCEIKIVVSDDTSNQEVANLNSSLCKNIAAYIKNPTSYGIAKNKNQCLRLLQGSERIFLFDDDTFPISPEWIEPFLHLTEEYNIHHAMYLQSYGPRLDHVQPIISHKDYTVFNHCLGCMLYMTEDALQIVGGFDERMMPYGYEHAQWSNRYQASCKQGGFAQLATPFVSIPKVRKYIFSTDVNANPNRGDLDTSDLIDTREVIQNHCRSLREVDENEVTSWVTFNSTLYHNIDKIYHPL